MNFEYARLINPLLENRDFAQAIQLAESKLKEIEATDFHHILGRAFTNPAGDLAQWIDNFYQEVSKKIEVKALYFEMNEFDINTSLWYIDGIAYGKDGGLDLENMSWLADCNRDTMTADEFVLTGLESLQDSFEAIEEKEENDQWTGMMQDARDWCEQIIIARFMELMQQARHTANLQKMKWADVPLYCTEHAYDMIVWLGNS